MPHRSAAPDVTVHGAGIFGLSVAWECVRRGARVRVIEVARIGAGSSGGLVGALAPHVPEQWNPKKAFQLQALLMAEAFWTEVAAVGGVDPGYARTGRLQPLADAAAVDLALSRAEGAKALWQGRAEWRVMPVASDGWAPAAPSGFMVQDTLTARMAPRRAAAALAAAIRARGGEIVEGEIVDGEIAEGGAAEPGGVQVWATGAAGLADLSADLGRSVGAAVKGQSALLRPALDVTALPQLFVDGLHIVPHADGSVALGSTSEREFEAGGTVDAQLEALIEKARGLCPALADAPVVERWAGLRPRARTRAPMLGAWPGRAGYFVANGGFKIGFGIAPKVAEVMADLVLEGRDAIPEGFRVEDSL